MVYNRCARYNLCNQVHFCHFDNLDTPANFDPLDILTKLTIFHSVPLYLCHISDFFKFWGSIHLFTGCHNLFTHPWYDFVTFSFDHFTWGHNFFTPDPRAGQWAFRWSIFECINAVLYYIFLTQIFCHLTWSGRWFATDWEIWPTEWKGDIFRSCSCTELWQSSVLVSFSVISCFTIWHCWQF